MDHQTLEKMTSTALMLPKEDGNEKVVIITPTNGGVGKILIREDTILANLQGCTSCGRANFTCGGVKKQWSALCWGKQTDKKYYTLLTILSMTFLLGLLGTVVFCFTNTIHNMVLSSMVIRNNSMAFSMWRRPSVHPLMKVHLFNYTNWQEVMAGDEQKLRVEDVGPYVYTQELERVNIQFNRDRLTFQEKNTFKYVQHKSVDGHSDFDKVYVPNLPLLGVASKAYELKLESTFLGMTALGTLEQALRVTNHPKAFIELPVQRFLWGYEDNIINTAKPILSFLGKLPYNFERFGLLVSKNGTVDDVLTINTGEYDKEKFNMIEKLNGKSSLDFWGGAQCNSLEASDGSMFPPSLLAERKPLYVFFPNLCRRLPFLFEKDVVNSDGIPLLRYRMPQDVFDDPAHNPDNQCYCEVDSGSCPPRGVINVTACAMGAPALASFPHFYLGAPSLRENILGLKPDPEKHDSFLDIHPTLGITLNGKSSLQLNIQVRKPSVFFSSLKRLDQELILPVAWIEMSVEELPASVKAAVYHGTYSTAALRLAGGAACVAALLASAAALWLLRRQRARRPCALLKVQPAPRQHK